MGVYVCMNMHKEMNKMNIHFCAYIHFSEIQENVTYQPPKTPIIQRKQSRFRSICTQKCKFEKTLNIYSKKHLIFENRVYNVRVIKLIKGNTDIKCFQISEESKMADNKIKR